MQGLHLTADFHDCRCEPHWLVDAQTVGAVCVEAVGLQKLGTLLHTFPATPATTTVLLAGSHLCVHTWPEERGEIGAEAT